MLSITQTETQSIITLNGVTYDVRLFQPTQPHHLTPVWAWKNAQFGGQEILAGGNDFFAMLTDGAGAYVGGPSHGQQEVLEAFRFIGGQNDLPDGTYEADSWELFQRSLIRSVTGESVGLLETSFLIDAWTGIATLESKYTCFDHPEITNLYMGTLHVPDGMATAVDRDDQTESAFDEGYVRSHQVANSMRFYGGPVEMELRSRDARESLIFARADGSVEAYFFGVRAYEPAPGEVIHATTEYRLREAA